MCSRTQMKISEKSFNQKNLIIKSFFLLILRKKTAFWDITIKSKIGIL
jgi:hypothetical protein